MERKTAYKCLLFDLDGTLTYSHRGIHNSIRYALQKMGRGEPTEEQLQKAIGPTLIESFTGLFGMTEEEAIKATAFYRERYSEKGMFENEPIPGAKALLADCYAAGYRLGLATLKPKIYANPVAEAFGFMPFFEVPAVSGLDGESTKTSVIEEIMRKMGVQPDECLMVGDRDQDVFGARGAGVKTAALRVGYAAEGELENASPEYIFDGFDQLRAFLLD